MNSIQENCSLRTDCLSCMLDNGKWVDVQKAFTVITLRSPIMYEQKGNRKSKTKINESKLLICHLWNLYFADTM